MQKVNGISFALLISTMALNNAAQAQTAVTLYGLVDDGLNFTSNASGHTAYQMVSGDTVGSRWGLKGTEDLGGGIKSVFRLESGFDSNNGKLGQGGLLFGRVAYIGVTSEQYGTLTMGRQYDPTIDMWSGFTGAGNWEGDFGAHVYDNDNSDWSYRTQNSVKYVSPTIAGFSGEALYGFSNDPAGFARNRVYSAAIQYQMGPVAAAVAYMKTNNGGINTTGAVSAATTVFIAKSQQNIDAGVSYKISDKALASFAYSHVDVNNPIGNAYFATQPTIGSQQSWRFDNFDISGQYFFTHNLWLGIAYTFTQAHVSTVTGSSAPKWNQVSFTLDYDLSARTSFYVQGAWQHANGNTGEDFDHANIAGSAGQSSNGNQIVGRVAMTHHF